MSIKGVLKKRQIQGVPLTTEPSISLIIILHCNIAIKFEQEYVLCVRNEKECVCSATRSSGKIIKEKPGTVVIWTPCIFQQYCCCVGA